MRAKSNRAARQHHTRINRLRATLDSPVRCGWPWGCAAEATDAHESLNRSQGGDPTDPDWLLCRPHHDAVTSAHGEARGAYVEAGLIRSRPMTERTHSRTVGSMPKRPLTIRVPESADAWLQDVMAEAGATQATVVRAMLSTATQHRPEVLAKVRQLQADT